MNDSPDDSTRRFSLSRWSRRKHEIARAKASPQPASPPAPPAVDAPAVVAPTPASAEPLPAVESLTIDSDFAPFLAPKVDETIKRAALRKLFSDPRFNVMDGLDTYIGDYSKADPLPEGMLAKLNNVYQTLTKEDDKPAAADDRLAEAQTVVAPEAAAPLLAPDSKDDTAA